MTIEFIIIVSLAVGAAIFVVIVATTLVIHKWVSTRIQRKLDRLHEHYAQVVSEIILKPLPPLPPGAKTSAIFKQYEELITPIKDTLAAYPSRRRRLHRKAIREVMVHVAHDVVGEPFDRLLYFFYSLNFVEDEIALMKSRQWWIRALAARELGLLRARKSITALTAALEDPHPDVRTQAMQSLVAIAGVEALPNILRLTRNMSRWVAIELSVIVKRFGSAAAPALLGALDHDDVSVVMFCLEMLGEIGFVDAVTKVRQVAERHQELRVRAKAIDTLGRLGDVRVEDTLLQYAGSPIDMLRISALRALARIGIPSAIPVLLKRIHQGPLEEKLEAARALAHSGALGIEHLRALRTTDDPQVRAVAEQVIEEVELLSIAV